MGDAVGYDQFNEGGGPLTRCQHRYEHSWYQILSFSET